MSSKQIKKSREARERRRNNGGRKGHHQPVWTGTTTGTIGGYRMTTSKQYCVSWRLKDAGLTHREVVAEIGVAGSTGTVTNIINRRDEYEDQMLEHGYTYPDMELEPAD